MKKKILIVDNVDTLIHTRLEAKGYELTDGSAFTRDKIIEIAQDFYGFILRSRITIDKEIIDKSTNLRFIARVGSGMESIDTLYATEKGISCINSPEGNCDAVAEQNLGVALSLLNNVFIANKEVKNGIWNREANRGLELNNKTVGIIGYGNVGSCFAKKLSGIGCRVIAYDKYKTDFSNSIVESVDLNTIFNETHILSLHIPLTEDTYYLVNDEFINSFKNNIILLNTSRGPIVNTHSLTKGLKSGKIISAGLDVIEYEETSFETTSKMTENEDFKYLANNDKVILTPHIAGWTNESKIKLAQVLVDKILNLE